MSKRIFVTATNTDIGKSYTTKLLLKEYFNRGYRVGVIKLIETGVVNGSYPDGDELLASVIKYNKEFKNLKVEDIVPISYELPAAPFVASGGSACDLLLLEKSIKKIEKLCDVLIIEGAGGLYVPVDKEIMMIDLIKHFNASALLVTHCSLGCINDTLLSSKALDGENIPHIIAFNCRENDDSFNLVSKPYFEKMGFDIFKVDRDIDTISNLLYNL
jgi:dethiobiotin synthetase